MWDWDFNDWVEFHKQQNEWYENLQDECKTANMTEEQKKEYFENKNKPKAPPSPPQAYESPVGLIIYIAVMLGGSIFYDRWLIWIAATVIFIASKLKNSK